jgi:hypothetical protein
LSAIGQAQQVDELLVLLQAGWVANGVFFMIGLLTL